MILRNYLYLDVPTLDNYLSAMEGYQEVEVEETVTQQKKGGVEGNVKVLKGTAGGEKTTSRKRKLATTNEAKFQRLVDLISEDNEDKEIPLLDAFDTGIWNTLQRGEIIEVQANVTVPPMIQYTQAAQSMGSFLDLFKVVGVNISDDPHAEAAIQGFSSIGGILEQKPLPILFEAVSTKGFRFYAGLERKYLQCDLDQLLQGEVTIFGKVLRRVEKGKSEVVFDIFQDFTSMVKANRQQRREMDKKQKDLRHKLKGPAIILAPTAIYR